jgi:quercetin dioxygenase-like cupin family protein
MKILSNAERGCRKGPENWFTGPVWMDEVANPTAPARTQLVLVTYAPSARSNWHTHPLGQTLYIVTGLGWVQKQGEPRQAVRPGDVVVFAPNEVHWHGAEAGHTFVHLAMQEADETGQNVVWGEPVSDSEYA